MKKQTKPISKIALGAFKTLLMASVCLLFAMCAKTVSPDDVAQRLDAGDTLSQDDYTAMIDYCSDYAKQAEQYQVIIAGQPNDSTPAYVKAAADLAALYAKYPHLDKFRNALYAVDMSQLSDANRKKIDEYSKYSSFPIPGGDGPALQQPEVVGAIEDMPDTDTNGVIATGDGEAVDINVKN